MRAAAAPLTRKYRHPFHSLQRCSAPSSSLPALAASAAPQIRWPTRKWSSNCAANELHFRSIRFLCIIMLSRIYLNSEHRCLKWHGRCGGEQIARSLAEWPWVITQADL